MKVSVVYHSESGHTAKMGSCIVEGLLSVEGIEAKGFNIDSLDKDFVRESKALIVGTPVYAGTLSGKMKMWLEKETRELGLAGKIGGAYATANFIHGGADIAIQSIFHHLMVYGMLLYSGGASQGQPYIHFGPVAIAPDLDKFTDLFKVFGQRMGQKALEIF